VYQALSKPFQEMSIEVDDDGEALDSTAQGGIFQGSCLKYTIRQS
jgi:hypothetical protein